mmetsp:Transcript_37865/g.122423  ORF Transcript_37865/g.122423 Transcript_37865/m.122423 type:complete len:366 (+) Transcript_37865:1182-2279(+)
MPASSNLAIVVPFSFFQVEAGFYLARCSSVSAGGRAWLRYASDNYSHWVPHVIASKWLISDSEARRGDWVGSGGVDSFAAGAQAEVVGEAPVAEAEGLRLHLSSRCSTGYAGVSKSTHCTGRFHARHKVGGRSLGSFGSAVEAAVAYARAVGEADEAGEEGEQNEGGEAGEAGEKVASAAARRDLAQRSSGRRRSVPARFVAEPSLQGDESQLEFVEKLLLPAAQEAVPQQHAAAPPPEAAMKFGVGDAVLGKFGPDGEGKTGGVLDKWYRAVVRAVNADGTYSLEYEDGDSWEQVPRVHVRARKRPRDDEASSASEAAEQAAAQRAESEEEAKAEEGEGPGTPPGTPLPPEAEAEAEAEAAEGA